jgi:hypothetical protein
LRFTVRRPPTGEVSPCGHRPSGGDVSCSVDVGVAPTGSAGFALENRLALTVPRSDVPASRASLRRVSSRNLLDPAQSLVLQTRADKTPTTSADRAVKPPFLSHSRAGSLDSAARGPGHRAHVKGLDSDHVKPSCEVGGGFLHPVLAPISFAGFELCDRAFRLLAAVGAALGPGELLLQNLQPLRLTRGKTGRVQQFVGRQRSRNGNTPINANHAAVARAGDRFRDVRECDMPTASPIPGDTVGLNPIRHRPRQAQPHPADLRHPDPTVAAVQPLDMMRSQPNLPKPFVHTGLTPRRAAVRTGEELLHGLCKIPQRLLLHSLTAGTKPRIFGAGLGQLCGLLDIAGGLAPRLPVLLLLHRQVPHIPRVPAVRQQCLLLLRGRQQAKPRHTRTVTADTDIPDRSTPTPPRIDFLLASKSGASNRRRLR